MTALTARLGTGAMRRLAPPPDLALSDWADTYRRLSSESSSEPGQWRTDRAPYQRGIMDAISDKRIETVVVMSSSQIGKTEIVNNAIGYYVHQDPAPTMMVQPTKEMAEAWSKDRLTPMVRDTPALAGLISVKKKRDGENTILHKTFPGGHITISGANSPASLASRPIRILLLDEVDRYPLSAGREGDPVNLARKRTVTFWNRKVIMVSTPTIKGQSRIEAAYLESDMRRYHVPCPHCGTMQHLEWKQLQWPNGEPEKAAYACIKCGVLLTDGDKPGMLKAGEWRAKGEFSGTAGFHLNELYSPWVAWGEMAKRFLEDRKLPDTLKTFINTALAETWEDDREAESLDEDVLLKRAEAYEDVPEGVLLLTCGVDVQGDRLEYEVVGWGRDEESWSIEYKAIPGDPGLPATWADLTAVLETKYAHASGVTLSIASMCVDTGGHHSEHVYRYCYRMKREGFRVFPIKGSSTPNSPIVTVPKKNNIAGQKLYSVGTDTAKDVIFSRLGIEHPGPGYCHFPLTHDDAYFAGLVSEKRVQRYERGRTVRKYVPKSGVRNEPLDCRVYNLAALAILSPGMARVEQRMQARIRKMQEENGEVEAEEGGGEATLEAEKSEPPKKPQPRTKKKKRSRRRGSGYVNAWRG